MTDAAPPRAIDPADLVQHPGDLPQHAGDRRKHYEEVDRLRRAPVQWLSPKELARTGLKAAQAGMFGEFADKREVEAGLPAEYYDFSGAGPGDFWFDYISDIGDGFNATYATAAELAKPELTLPAPDGGKTVVTQRGRLLVLGGDEVYPVGAATNYENRTTKPYGAALPVRGPDSPAVLAVPGNHDWYDGLTAFLRVFCQSWLDDPSSPQSPESRQDGGTLRRVDQASRNMEFMGGWRTLQSRSYFAAKLPHNWWVWGIDIQFDTYIDAPQLAYFIEAAKLVGDGSIVLCTAKPSWVDLEEEPASFETLQWFMRRILGDNIASVRLIVSGDSHHYARYQLPGAPQLITCGGGGAYLSATHDLPADLKLDATLGRVEGGAAATYRRERIYPDDADSKGLAWRHFLAIPHRNAWFASLAGGLYVLFTLLAAAAQKPVAGGFGARLLAFDGIHPSAFRFAPPILPALVLAVLIVLGAIGLTQPAPGRPGRWRKVAVGTAHGLAHLVAALVIGTVIAAALRALQVTDWPGVAKGLLFTAAVSVVGALFGSFLLAGYLIAASRLARVNTNELYAGMQIEDRKSFLRLRVDADTRELHVYPVKLHDIPRTWRFDEREEPPGSLFTADGTPAEPALIEPEITVSPRPRPEL
jgi:hypothetical protein